jgi:lysylphosphatidylglycerol synthetase-like protein (DUF2156 family)
LSDEGLEVLLQTYISEYTIYAALFLTGVLGALTVLLIWKATRRGRIVFSIAYCVSVLIVLLSFCRLLQYSRNVHLILEKLNLLSLDREIQAEGAWLYNIFDFIFQYVNLVLITGIAIGIVIFFGMWWEVNKSMQDKQSRQV